jgi:hypothetical protein
MSGVLANSHRRRMAAATASAETSVRPLRFVAFGDGAANPDGTVVPINRDAEGLINELLRKEVVPFQEDDYSATVTASLDKNELVGSDISEVAVFDDLGRVVAFRHFKAKPKEADEAFRVNIKIRY